MVIFNSSLFPTGEYVVNPSEDYHGQAEEKKGEVSAAKDPYSLESEKDQNETLFVCAKYFYRCLWYNYLILMTNRSIWIFNGLFLDLLKEDLE